MSPKPLFKVNDKVFAKVRGYPPWPGLVAGVLDNGTPSKTKYSIHFYGTFEHANCKPEDICLYEENKLKLGVPRKNKFFVEALAQIEDSSFKFINLSPNTKSIVTRSRMMNIKNSPNKTKNGEILDKRHELLFSSSNTLKTQNVAEPKMRLDISDSKGTKRKLSDIKPDISTKKTMPNDVIISKRLKEKDSASLYDKTMTEESKMYIGLKGEDSVSLFVEGAASFNKPKTFKNLEKKDSALILNKQPIPIYNTMVEEKSPSLILAEVTPNQPKTISSLEERVSEFFKLEEKTKPFNPKEDWKIRRLEGKNSTEAEKVIQIEKITELQSSTSNQSSGMVHMEPTGNNFTSNTTCSNNEINYGVTPYPQEQTEYVAPRRTFRPPKIVPTPKEDSTTLFGTDTSSQTIRMPQTQQSVSVTHSSTSNQSSGMVNMKPTGNNFTTKTTCSNNEINYGVTPYQQEQKEYVAPRRIFRPQQIVPTPKEDSTTLFGKYLVEKLKQFPESTKSRIIHDINQIVFEYESK